MGVSTWISLVLIRNLLFYHKFIVILWQIIVMANLGTYRR